MRFVHEMTYAAAPAAVAQMMADPAFREQVCEHQQVLDYTVSVHDDDGVLRVAIDQTQEARGIPSFAMKFVGETIEIEQRETWHSELEADLEVVVPGKPARMAGTILLRGVGSETVESVAGEIDVSVPLIGGRVEEVIGNVVRLALDAEYTVGQRWLAERG